MVCLYSYLMLYEYLIVKSTILPIYYFSLTPRTNSFEEELAISEVSDDYHCKMDTGHGMADPIV